MLSCKDSIKIVNTTWVSPFPWLNLMPWEINNTRKLFISHAINLSEGKEDTEAVLAILMPPLNDNLNTLQHDELWGWQEPGLW